MSLGEFAVNQVGQWSTMILSSSGDTSIQTLVCWSFASHQLVVICRILFTSVPELSLAYPPTDRSSVVDLIRNWINPAWLWDSSQHAELISNLPVTIHLGVKRSPIFAISNGTEPVLVAFCLWVDRVNRLNPCCTIHCNKWAFWSQNWSTID